MNPKRIDRWYHAVIGTLLVAMMWLGIVVGLFGDGVSPESPQERGGVAHRVSPKASLKL
jgi:hypothetical protein